tara:strand:+ start:2449 stop:2649 length:201 start_codon:yes stop_codon:yes gene_type:complete
MSTEFKTNIDGIKITRFSGGEEGLMYIVSRRLTEERIYRKSISMVLTRDEAREIALQLLKVTEEEV